VATRTQTSHLPNQRAIRAYVVNQRGGGGWQGTPPEGERRRPQTEDHKQKPIPITVIITNGPPALVELFFERLLRQLIAGSPWPLGLPSTPKNAGSKIVNAAQKWAIWMAKKKIDPPSRSNQSSKGLNVVIPFWNWHFRSKLFISLSTVFIHFFKNWPFVHSNTS